jgi:hypothetical protein
MNDSSWLLLDSQDERYTLPDDLRESDAFGARDVGWVEQMRPFIAAFSRPGDVVLDPFAGFGTTLLAAALEGRRGLGIEADTARAWKIGERIGRHGFPAPEIRVGDCVELASSLPAVNLVLTSVPYFGCTGRLGGDAAQRYRDQHYATWLERMRLAFKALAQPLAHDGYIIVMAENVRIGGQFVPQAWDIARLLADRFVMQEERVIVYPRAATPSVATGSVDPGRTNRSHEYALIARHVERAIDIDATLDVLAMLDAHARMAIYGSLATFLGSGDGSPADADVLLAHDTDVVALAARLEDVGFRITRWGEPVESPAAAEAMRAGFYLLAERIDRDGRLCRIDLAVADSAEAFERQTRFAERIRGILVMGAA